MMSESQKIPESISVELIRDQRTVLPLLGMGRGWLVVDKPENALITGLSGSFFIRSKTIIFALQTLINAL